MLSYIVNQLNSYYNSPGMYAFDTVVDFTTGGTGGGPSGLIYNTHTVQDVATAVIGSASSSAASSGGVSTPEIDTGGAQVGEDGEGTWTPGGGVQIDAGERRLNKVRIDMKNVPWESRAAKLLPNGAIATSDYEATLSDAAAQRARWIDAQNRVSRADTEREVSTLQVNAAEAAVREARSLRGKAEVLVDPVKTLRRAVETRHADLERLKQGKTGSSSETQDRADQIKDVTAELDRLREYLKTAEAIDPFRQSGFPTVRQAKEALNDAALALERTTIKASTDGIVANFQLTEGTYARPGIPVASLIDTTRWRMVAAVPENWLEKIRPGDEVYFSLRNYPGRLRTAKVEYVGRGVVQGQGVPSGNLPDTDPRRIRQTDTPQAGQEFQVVINLQDDQPDQPLRVGATGRVTIFAGGGFPVVNGLATILHTVFSWLDYLHPKPSLLVVALAVALIIGVIAYLRRRSNAAAVK